MSLASAWRKRAQNEKAYRSRRRVAAHVVVDGAVHRLHLASRPLVGTTLNIGFPVVVTGRRDVAGGGVIVRAERIVVQAPEDGAPG